MHPRLLHDPGHVNKVQASEAGRLLLAAGPLRVRALLFGRHLRVGQKRFVPFHLGCAFGCMVCEGEGVTFHFPVFFAKERRGPQKERPGSVRSGSFAAKARTDPRPPAEKRFLALRLSDKKLGEGTCLRGVARFYDHFIGSAITKKYQVYEAEREGLTLFRDCERFVKAQALMDICMVHFAPGPKLHQTLTYKADKTALFPGRTGRSLGLSSS